MGSMLFQDSGTERRSMRSVAFGCVRVVGRRYLLDRLLAGMAVVRSAG